MIEKIYVSLIIKGKKKLAEVKDEEMKEKVKRILIHDGYEHLTEDN